MTNFDYLKKERKFKSFSDTAVTAETLYHIDTASCAIAVRRTAEFAVKWLMWVVSKVFIEFITILFLFMLWLFGCEACGILTP